MTAASAHVSLAPNTCDSTTVVFDRVTTYRRLLEPTMAGCDTKSSQTTSSYSVDEPAWQTAGLCEDKEYAESRST